MHFLGRENSTWKCMHETGWCVWDLQDIGSPGRHRTGKRVGETEEVDQNVVCQAVG